MGDLSYAFTIGESGTDRQGIYLLRSIKQQEPDSEVIVFRPEDEEVEEEALEEVREKATLVNGERPITDYPISSKIEALKAAEEVSDSEYVLLMDTDSLLVDNIEVHRGNGSELFLKPVDLGLPYWSNDVPVEEQKELYNRYGYEFPEERVESTVDHVEIPPSWNAGFVLVENHNFGERWLELTEKVYDEVDRKFNADQVALAMLATEYKVEKLDNRYGFPLPHRFYCPSSVKHVHYHEIHQLLKPMNRKVKEKVSETGIYNEIPKNRLDSYRKLFWDCLKTVKGRTLGYK